MENINTKLNEGLIELSLWLNTKCSLECSKYRHYAFSYQWKNSGCQREIESL